MKDESVSETKRVQGVRINDVSVYQCYVKTDRKVIRKKGKGGC